MLSISRITTDCLAAVVTADVCIAIITHWKNYDLLGRFLGIVLTLNLGVGLFVVLKKPREGRIIAVLHLSPWLTVHYCWPPCCLTAKMKKFHFGSQNS
jgi:hypothetical protein